MSQGFQSRLVSSVMCAVFSVITVTSDVMRCNMAFASELALPAPTQLVQTSKAFSYPVLKGLKLNPNNPLDLTFIVDTQDKSAVNEEEAQRLVNYFLAAVAVPQKDLWVNLSPYEKDRVVTDELGQTVLGEKLLAQDYLLKQLSSSLTSPDTELGKEYWNTSVNAETFNKIWIMPDKAEVYEHGNQVFVTEATLKVMSDSDYTAMQQNGAVSSGNGATDRLVPAVAKEVNEGEHFAATRQAYYSIILGLWFKEKLKASVFKDYIDAKQVNGIAQADPQSKEQIFNAYVESFKKGVYNTSVKTRENGRLVKKAYFSGGQTYADTEVKVVASAVLNGKVIEGTAEEFHAYLQVAGDKIPEIYVKNKMLSHNQGHAQTTSFPSTIALLGAPTMSYGVDHDGLINRIDDAGRMVFIHDKAMRLASVPFVRTESGTTMLTPSVPDVKENRDDIPLAHSYYHPSIAQKDFSFGLATPLAELSYRLGDVNVARRIVPPLLSGNDDALMPASVEEYTLVNKGEKAQQMTIVIPMPSLVNLQEKKFRPTEQDNTYLGRPAVNGHVHTSFSENGMTGVVMGSTETSDRMVVSVPQIAGAKVDVQNAFRLSAIKQDLLLNPDGSFYQHLDPKANNDYGAAISVTVTVQPGASVTVPVAIALDFPHQRYVDGASVERAYARNFTDEKTRVVDMARTALHNYSGWFKRTQEIQDKIYQGVSKMSGYKGDAEATDRLARLMFNELSYFLSNASVWTKDDVARFLECFDYPFNNSADVDWYSMALLMVFPEIEKRICQSFIDSINVDNPEMSFYHMHTSVEAQQEFYANRKDYEGKSMTHIHDKRKVPGSVFHDLGAMTRGNPLREGLSEYDWYNTNYWNDLFPKLALRVLRNAKFMGDKEFVKNNWEKMQKGFEFLMTLDHDGDGVPEGNKDEVRNTFDNLPLFGVDAYSAGLFIASCNAMARMAEMVDDIAARDMYLARAEKAKLVFEKLWVETTDSSGNKMSYYATCFDPKTGEYNTDVWTNQFDGLWASLAMGEESFIPAERVKASLLTVYRHNRTQMGWATARKQDGSEVDSDQGKDVWIASNYVFAQLLDYYGLVEESKDVYATMDRVIFEYGKSLITPESVRPGFEQEAGEEKAGPHSIVDGYPRPGAVFTQMVLSKRKEIEQAGKIMTDDDLQEVINIWRSGYAPRPETTQPVNDKTVVSSSATGGMDMKGMKVDSKGSSAIELNTKGIDPAMFKNGIAFTIANLKTVTKEYVLASLK